MNTITMDNATENWSPVATLDERTTRPHVRGKFLFIGDTKFYPRGTTYGAFRADADGNEYVDRDIIERDFAQMAHYGFNTVRIPHTTPPRYLLDIAQRHGLRVMVGLSAEQNVGYLNDKRDTPDIERGIREKVRSCAGHPALLCYALGNEIPAEIARWFGAERIERYLERLHDVVKDEDPDGLVTYVNYPTTEYLKLPFLDLVCFNVYLETQDRLEAYLARLQNIAGDRPLMMSEIGLDSLRNGEAKQAEVLAWQIRTTFAAGCAGAFVFSWTDDWYRGEEEVLDWAFGLTDKARRPKPALAAVLDAYRDVPFASDISWPRVSVVVCSCNGARTIRDCCDGLSKLDYPNYDVIVVDDGSNDATARIVHEYGFRIISTENRGLSAARNTGYQAATGEIIAYTDDDARPDPHWLQYLAATFMRTNHVGVGGPNIAPAGDGLIADCVANAPGGPVHVLLTDTVAEHIPGCNSAYRKSALEAVGGFDPRYRVAGDDVDLCWRLQERGWTLGFNPAAMVSHHRRNSVRTYWRQQKGYGKAEALLEQKWPARYNAPGHVAWNGRLYGSGLTRPLLWKRGRVYQGLWGSAPFQSLYERTPSDLLSLPLMPEWYLLILVLGASSALGILWHPLTWVLPFLAVAILGPVIQAGVSASSARFTSETRTRRQRGQLVALTALLHLLQPLGRLIGRQQHGLTPWRLRGTAARALPRPKRGAIWRERWIAPEQYRHAVETRLRELGSRIVLSGEFDRWDFEVRGGGLASARLLMAVEDHGAGNQYVRYRIWHRWAANGIALICLLALLALAAGLSRAWLVAGLLGLGAATTIGWALWESAGAAGLLQAALDQFAGDQAT